MEHTGRVLANGVFDILHPGHIYYLEQAAALGDELYVVVTPDSMTEKETVFDEEERVRVVDALGCVDNAFLGSEDEKTHVYDTVNRVEPGIIVLGYDQDFDVDQLRKDLAEHGFTVDVTRIDQYLGETTSSTEIRRRIRQSGT